jgi:hypothetical protein
MSATENNKITKAERRPSLMDMVKEKQNDQDFNQKMGVASTLLLEIYRVLMGAFLVMFVPQKCGDGSCSLTQNINRTGALSQITLACNALTMLSFLGLYFVEVKRENKLINYLDVNRFTPVDNESVGNSLEKLSTKKKQNILAYDGYYQKAGYASTAAFILNAIMSSIVIFSNYLDNKTLTVYFTNLLFMGMKVADVYSTVNTKKNIFYSAYLKNKVQYNDVDPDKIKSEGDSDYSGNVGDLSPIEDTPLDVASRSSDDTVPTSGEVTNTLSESATNNSV